jgi:flagellar biosynthetic protein FliR
MPTDFIPSTNLILSFFGQLLRIGSLFLPLGLPGGQNAPGGIKMILVLALAVVTWRHPTASSYLTAPTSSIDIIWLCLGELAYGTLVGVTAAIAMEGVSFAMHLAGVNAGYQFASTIDPTSQADSTVLPALGQLLGLVLFFAIGMDHLLVKALSVNGETWPPGQWLPPLTTVALLERLGAEILKSGLMMALPLLVLLVLIDLSLAVITRAHAQMQLITLAFPLKMMLSLVLLAAVIPTWRGVWENQVGRFGEVERALERAR